VATPLWFVADGRRQLVMTDARSFKARRIRHHPEVMLGDGPSARWMAAGAGLGGHGAGSDAAVLAITPV
jgi:hypothetical protein